MPSRRAQGSAGAGNRAASSCCRAGRCGCRSTADTTSSAGEGSICGKSCRAGRGAAAEAERVRTRFLNQVDERRNPCPVLGARRLGPAPATHVASHRHARHARAPDVRSTPSPEWSAAPAWSALATSLRPRQGHSLLPSLSHQLVGQFLDDVRDPLDFGDRFQRVPTQRPLRPPDLARDTGRGWLTPFGPACLPTRDRTIWRKSISQF